MNRASGRLDRLKAELDSAASQILADGERLNAASVGKRVGIGKSTIYGHQELLEVVRQHSSQQSAAAMSAEYSAAFLRSRQPREETPLGLLADDWISGRCERGELSGRSPEIMTTQLNGLCSVFGRRPVAELDRRALLDWQASIGQTAAATRRKYLSTVRQFCAWLVEEGHLEHDPSAGLARIREPRRMPRALRRSDVAALLLRCPDSRGRAMVWLMVGCGLRCTEVSSLDLADYDSETRTILVRGKGGYERVLPVPDEAAGALDTYLAQRGWRAGPLFLATGSKGMPDGRISARWISKRTGRIMTAAGIHQPGDGRSAHALRHTAASDVMDQCKNVRVVQQMLGHTSLQTTQIYLRAANLDDLRAAMSGRTYDTTAP